MPSQYINLMPEDQISAADEDRVRNNPRKENKTVNRGVNRGWFSRQLDC
jgi:hypothetical protein